MEEDDDNEGGLTQQHHHKIILNTVMNIIMSIIITSQELLFALSALNLVKCCWFDMVLYGLVWSVLVWKALNPTMSVGYEGRYGAGRGQLKERMMRRLLDNKGIKMLNLKHLKLDLKILRYLS